MRRGARGLLRPGRQLPARHAGGRGLSIYIAINPTSAVRRHQAVHVAMGSHDPALKHALSCGRVSRWRALLLHFRGPRRAAHAVRGRRGGRRAHDSWVCTHPTQPLLLQDAARRALSRPLGAAARTRPAVRCRPAVQHDRRRTQGARPHPRASRIRLHAWEKGSSVAEGVRRSKGSVAQ